jgi:hypothetical protein
MLELSADQQTALARGEAVPCVVSDTQCIVVRKDVFERMQHVAYDDSEWTSDEMIAIAKYAFNDADTAGPIP